MKIGKVLLAGVVVGILDTVLGWLTCGWLFNWVYTLEPTSIWRPSGEMPFALMNITNLIAGFFLAFVYAVIYKGLPGKGIVKGFWFGLFVWVVGAGPGNAILGMVTIIAQTVILYWIIRLLVISLLKGLVIAGIYGKNE